MTSDYVGSVVSVKLNNGSTIRGRVLKISPNTISLTELAGKHKKDTLDLFSNEITDLDIVSLPTRQIPDQKQITIMRRDQSPTQRGSSPSPNDMISDNMARKQFNDMIPDNMTRKQYKKGDAFSVSVTNMSTDFDFQSSNKLFQKETIFDEWRQQDGNLPRHSNSDKLKPTEMVTERESPALGSTFEGDFMTDDKIPLMGLTLSKRIALFKRAINFGLSYSHVVSVAGMSVSQMVIQVLGGTCRVSLLNHNKPPVVAALVSSGESGKVAVTSALHLSQHGINVKVVLFATPKGCDGLVNILKKCKCVVEKGLQGLPNVIDIVIDGTQDRSTLLNWPDWMNSVIDWTDQSTAPIVAVDPQHPTQMPRSPTPPKFTCSLGAPLLSQGQAGRLFLIDIGLFPLAFKEEEIPYRSPFFDKFIIPLNRCVKQRLNSG